MCGVDWFASASVQFSRASRISQNCLFFLDERYNIVSGKTISRMIKDISKEADTYHKTLFINQSVLSATTDVWTVDSGDSYCSLPVSFIGS